MTGNAFESPFAGRLLSEQVTNPNILVGRYSYYSGYYHRHGFDDCARYLLPDRTDVDRLIIGSFCSIGSGAAMLLEMAWWDWPLERISAALPLLCNRDIPALHAFWRQEPAGG